MFHKLINGKSRTLSIHSVLKPSVLNGFRSVTMASVAARGQQKARVRRIGILMPFPKGDARIQANTRVFRQELARLGWSEGGNVQFDERWSTDNMDLVRADAASLVEINPDVILITGDRVIPVFMKLTRSIPNRSWSNQRSDRVRRGGKSRAAGPQCDGVFARRILDVRKDGGDFEADELRTFPESA